MIQLPETVRYYVAGIWARRWSALALAVIISVLGWLAVVSLPSNYTSQARIYVDTDTLLKPLMKGLSVDQDTKEQVEIVRTTLLSRPNVEKLARMTDLDLQADSDAQFERLVTRLQSKIHLKAERPTLFKVSYTHQDPAMAQRVVDSMLDIFIEENLGRSQQDVDSAQRFLDKQIAKYEAQLREADKKITAFKRQNAEALAAPRRAQRQLDELERDLRNLQSERDTLIWKREQLRLRLSETPQRLPVSQASGMGGGPTPAEQELATLRQQLAGLQTKYTDQHPDVQYVQRRISSVEARVTAENGQTGNGDTGQTRMVPNPAYDEIRQEARATEARITALEDRSDRMRTRVQALQEQLSEAPEAEAKLAELTRDYAVLEGNYQEMLQRRERARIAASVDAENTGVDFRIVEPANKPVVPSGPARGIFMSAVLAVGLGAGVGASALRLQLAQTFVSAEQLRSAFGLPVLGGVTRVESRHRTRRILGHVAFVSLIAALVLICALGFYLFQMRAQPLDTGEYVQGAIDRISLWWSLRN